jgi:hypothetical protein
MDGLAVLVPSGQSRASVIRGGLKLSPIMVRSSRDRLSRSTPSWRTDGPLPLVMNPANPLGDGDEDPLGLLKGSYLVDPASSHMLVSKIKPCMSKYKQLYSETANGSLNQL